MIRSLAILATLVLILSACSMSADTTAAEQAVTRFHQQLDAGQFDEIYEGSDDAFKKAGNKKNLNDLLSAVHRKLGKVKSKTKTNWHINVGTGGTIVKLAYNTAYAEGEASEQFTFRMKDKAATLVSYHINSNTLILK